MSWLSSFLARKKRDEAPEDAPGTLEAPQRDFTAERDTEIIPAARELLARLAVQSDLKIGSSATIGGVESAAAYYQKFYQEEVVPMLRARNLKLADVPYLFQLMGQAVQLVSDVTTSSLAMNRDIGEAKVWGVKEKDDVRVADLERVLMPSATPANVVAPSVDKEVAPVE